MRNFLKVAALLLAAVGPLAAQSTTFEGTVFIDGTQTPIVNAEIALTDINLTTSSDSSGNFSFLHVPTGAHELRVRVVGFAPYAATIMSYLNRPFASDFFLKKQATQLGGVSVTAKAEGTYSKRLDEFDARRRTGGGGTYVTGDVFEKEQGRKVSDILNSRVPGARSQCKESECHLYSARGGMTFRQKGGPCFAAVVVNGVIVYNGTDPDGKGANSISNPGGSGQPVFDINSINASDIIGLEYHSTGSVPSQYNATGNMCGTVIIWTK